MYPTTVPLSPLSGSRYRLDPQPLEVFPPTQKPNRKGLKDRKKKKKRPASGTSSFFFFAACTEVPANLAGPGLCLMSAGTPGCAAAHILLRVGTYQEYRLSSLHQRLVFILPISRCRTLSLASASSSSTPTPSLPILLSSTSRQAEKNRRIHTRQSPVTNLSSFVDIEFRPCFFFSREFCQQLVSCPVCIGATPVFLSVAVSTCVCGRPSRKPPLHIGFTFLPNPSLAFFVLRGT